MAIYYLSFVYPGEIATGKADETLLKHKYVFTRSHIQYGICAVKTLDPLSTDVYAWTYYLTVNQEFSFRPTITVL